MSFGYMRSVTRLNRNDISVNLHISAVCIACYLPPLTFHFTPHMKQFVCDLSRMVCADAFSNVCLTVRAILLMNIDNTEGSIKQTQLALELGSSIIIIYSLDGATRFQRSQFSSFKQSFNQCPFTQNAAWSGLSRPILL